MGFSNADEIDSVNKLLEFQDAVRNARVSWQRAKDVEVKATNALVKAATRLNSLVSEMEKAKAKFKLA